MRYTINSNTRPIPANADALYEDYCQASEDACVRPVSFETWKSIGMPSEAVIAKGWDTTVYESVDEE